MDTRTTPVLTDPPMLTRLFQDARYAWYWAVLRVYLGWQWLQAGWHKVPEPAWTQTGEAMRGFLMRAVQVPAEGKPVVTYDWYRAFLQMLLDGGHYTWFAKVVAYGEVALGILLIIGAFTGFAALAGAFANMNFMLAGTASTNPVLFLISMLLLLAWKHAGTIGVDRWLLPRLGTPWGRRAAGAAPPPAA